SAEDETKDGAGWLQIHGNRVRDARRHYGGKRTAQLRLRVGGYDKDVAGEHAAKRKCAVGAGGAVLEGAELALAEDRYLRVRDQVYGGVFDRYGQAADAVQYHVHRAHFAIGADLIAGPAAIAGHRVGHINGKAAQRNEIKL